jgi:hypothetical protein
MKRTGGIVLIVLVAVAIAYAWLRPRPKNYPDAFIGERTAIVWNSLAAVRQPVAAVHFGEKVGVVDRRSDQVRVQLRSGQVGWVDARVLMDSALWERSAKLLVATRKMPVQATGRTKVATNVRLEAGRTAPRLFQFGRDVPVQVFGRASAEWAPSGEEGSSRDPSGEDAKPKHEDWFLIRGRAPVGTGNRTGSTESAQPGSTDAASESVEVAGWVVARFIEFDLPDTIKDYTSSSGMRVLAWFELNSVPEAPGSATEKPQYLVAGVRGEKDYGCDFNMLRAYTWGAARHRYETAYVESGLCGLLPVRVGRSSAGDPEFRFQAQGKSLREERVYRMRQTSVRRVREANEAPVRKRK